MEERRSEQRGRKASGPGLSIVDQSRLRRRKTVIGWLAFALGAAAFFLLLISHGAAFALQFAIGMTVLTVLGFRWLTAPVHPGVFAYISPHTVILIHSFIYFGIGSLPRLAFPSYGMIGYYNIGSTEYYLPALMLGLLGMLSFDLVYRWCCRAFLLNCSLERCFLRLYSSEFRGFVPVSAGFWYAVCMGLFIYMTGRYLMRPFLFVGVEGEVDNIFRQSSYFLLGTAWILMSLCFFQTGKKSLKATALALLGLLIPVMFGYQNRRIIVYCLAMSVAAYFFYKKKGIRLSVVIWGGVIVLGAFMLMSSVKYVAATDPSLKRYLQEEKNIFARAGRIVSSPLLLKNDVWEDMLGRVIMRRLNGLDWAAAMMESRRNSGIAFLKGRHNLLTAAKIVPRVVWPSKPTVGLEAFVTRHFELSYFDQLGSLLGSAYADGGIIGVVLGFAFLGLFFVPALKLIFWRPDGIIIYMGAMIPLLAYENFIFKYTLQWLRWVLILMVINSMVLFAYRLIRTRSSLPLHS